MSDPYFWYVTAAYISGLVLIGGLAAHIVHRARQTRARLAAEEVSRQ